jgi:hypothetical protein
VHLQAQSGICAKSTSTAGPGARGALAIRKAVLYRTVVAEAKTSRYLARPSFSSFTSAACLWFQGQRAKARAGWVVIGTARASLGGSTRCQHNPLHCFVTLLPVEKQACLGVKWVHPS